MIDRKWYVGLPLAVAVGGSALAIGLVPGVRSWLDQTFPQLGINGQPSSSASSPASFGRIDAESLGSATLKDIDGAATNLTADQGSLLELSSEPAASLDEGMVRFAQATKPVENRNVKPTNALPVRFAQDQSPEIPQAPRSGIVVPVANNQAAQSRGGSLMVTNAQLRFPQDIFIAAQSEGIITELFVDDGSVVKQGDIMICLDPRIAQAESDVSTQELLAAKIKLKDDSSIRYAKAAVDVAQVELEISDDLNSQGAESDLDNRKKRLELTKAQLQITVSQNEKEQQAAAVALQEAKLKATLVQVELRKIPAHWDGFVSEVAKKQYSFVRPGEVICRLTSMKNIRVVGNAEVNVAPHLLLNAPARVRILVPGIPDAPVVDGVVTYVSPRSESPKVYPIHVDIENQLTPDGQYFFREGMEATIEVMVGAK